MGARGSKPQNSSKNSVLSNVRSRIMSKMSSSKGRSFAEDNMVMAAVAKVAPGDTQWDVEYRFLLAPSDHYHHHMPSNMPLCPVYAMSYVQECNRSWKIICKASTPKMKAYKKDGIVLFYDEFFYRLFQRDPGFNDIFPGIRKRIEVLIKAMKFLLNDAGVDAANVMKRCRNLGYRHKTIPLVRPHHFSAYSSTFIEVAMYWLDVEATPDVGEAWSNVVGFNLKYMLQAFLVENIDECEWNQNICAPPKVVEAADKRGVSKKDAKKAKKNGAAPPKKAHRPDDALAPGQH
ncbi:Aste57867_20385 [Aphanomyces stellatus]|uniref:Aste57867_20385 protein n=1 Tax=Aphanomyces stellatus TaxID=120398 RepID=A0A485LEZ3_9STRA|nr:hypothetical protein As57867_020319 [Aphanomyces stellatus]VFT97071.1 Aste57867_20385 [Aphanomyces stellatus]